MKIISIFLFGDIAQPYMNSPLQLPLKPGTKDSKIGSSCMNRLMPDQQVSLERCVV